MKKLKYYFAYILLLIFLAGCIETKNANEAPNANSKMIVVATFYPLYDITKKIAGDKIEVDSIVPAGIEPHDYEPSPNDIIKLGAANAFVTIGLEFSGIENKLIESQSGKLQVIDSKNGITFINGNQGKDPHIWMSPKNMILMTANIRDGLKKADLKNADFYEQNAKKVIQQLQQLDSDYKMKLSNCKKHVVITNHRAFAYLGNDYGFKQIGIGGLAPETEPTPQDLINIKNEAEKNNVTYIFSEELVDSRIADTIANEIGAKTLVLNPIEGIKNPSEDYFSLMRQNLANLKLALECS